jgi:hypothetical protein
MVEARRSAALLTKRYRKTRRAICGFLLFFTQIYLSDLPHTFSSMDHIEFSVSRLRILWDGDWDQPEFLAEVAYLYDQIVRTGTHEPIIDMGMKLIIPFEEVGEAVSNAMAWRYLTAPKPGTWGGAITNKARRELGQPIVRKGEEKLLEDDEKKGFWGKRPLIFFREEDE